MRTFTLLKGMKVYNFKGHTCGEIFDICIASEGKITSLILRGKGFLERLYRLPIEAVISYGENGIFIHGIEDLEKFKPRQDEYTMAHCEPLRMKKTKNPIGEQLGLLQDVYFLEEAGTIVGYELTDGFFSDILEGKKIIKALAPPEIGEDAIIVIE